MNVPRAKPDVKSVLRAIGVSVALAGAISYLVIILVWCFAVSVALRLSSPGNPPYSWEFRHAAAAPLLFGLFLAVILKRKNTRLFLCLLASAREIVVVWPEEQRLFWLLPREIAVDGAAKVMVVPTAKERDQHSPLVCHLVSRNYLADTDSMKLQRDFTVTLSNSLFGAQIEPAALHIARGDGSVEVGIPELPCGRS